MLILFNFPFQIEDLSQQAQVAAAEKFKAPEISPAADVGAGTTVSFIHSSCMPSLCYSWLNDSELKFDQLVSTLFIDKSDSML